MVQKNDARRGEERGWGLIYVQISTDTDTEPEPETDLV
jgi:hypothetical protein